MISTSNLSVQFGKRVLFDEVNTSFKKGNCYGIIGANGSGKSTFLKVLSGKLNPNSGIVSIEPGKRMSVLEQNHSAYDDFQVLQSTLMGNKELYDIKNEMDQLEHLKLCILCNIEPYIDITPEVVADLLKKPIALSSSVAKMLPELKDDFFNRKDRQPNIDELRHMHVSCYALSKTG